VNFSVHSLPDADSGAVARRTAKGRLQMLVVLLVCAAPVVAAYFTYFVVRPQSRTNYGALIEPPVAMPDALMLSTLSGQPVAAGSLKRQWLLVVVSGAQCDARCERALWLQRQLHETLGAEKDRVDKVWLIDDAGQPRAETLAAIKSGAPPTVLRASGLALERWLAPEPGHALQDHLYIVDPMGDWMMRMPAEPEPASVKRDVQKLLRASAGWDQPGR
jgi:hypothetical protein